MSARRSSTAEPSRADVVGMLLVATGACVRIPPRCWPIEIALEQLDADLTGRYALGRVVATWARVTTSQGRIFERVEALVRELALLGDVVPCGRGREAGYELTPMAQRKYFRQLAWLSDAEGDALQRSAQSLVASLTKSSKKDCASRPARSATV